MLPKNECYVIALYMYVLCSYIEETYKIKENLARITTTLANQLNLKKQLNSFFEKFELDCEKKGKLTPIQDSTKIHKFSMTNIPYKYQEDSIIDRNLQEDENIDSIFISILRYLTFCDCKNALKKLISKIFLSGRTPNTLTKKIRNFVDDIQQVKFIIDAVNLSTNEARILLLLYRIANISEITDISYHIINKINDFSSEIFKIEQNELNAIFRCDQKLRSFGFIDENLEITKSATNAIKTGTMDAFFSEILREEKTDKAFTLDSYSVDEESVKIAKQLLSCKNVNILLYGAPGSGKTEFAKSLAKSCSFRTLFFQNDEELNKPANVLSQLNCLLSINKPDSLIIIDEADSILETSRAKNLFFAESVSTAKKGTVNKIFENCKNRVIWIVNHTNQIEESTKRRFTYSIYFNEMPESTLRKIAKNRLSESKQKISEELCTKILNLCSQFHVTGSSVENVLRVIESAQNVDFSEESLIRNVRNVLEANSSLLYGKTKMRQFVSSFYDEQVLNTDFPASKIIKMVKNAILFSEREKSAKNGVRLLFYGESGTGKTEFARYISQSLGKKLLTKRASDIFGKYVGESEQNIKAAFEEAEQSGQILLFDEADSFFSSRENATKTWERTLVNEFLTQMEEFSGILICTTNLKKIMDKALNRRFHICVEFRALNKNGIRTLLSKYFSTISFLEDDVKKIAQFSTVTPGDFGALVSRLRFLDEEEISPAFVIDELIKLQKDKSNDREIGF